MKTFHRQRTLLSATVGLVLIGPVPSASMQDAAGGQLVLQRPIERIKHSVHNRWCRLKLIWADVAYAAGG